MSSNTTNYNLVKPTENESADITIINENMDKIDSALLENSTYETAGGTGTAITVTLSVTLTNGYSKTFIASVNNNAGATTLNGKNLYKPNTTTAPNIVAGKAYTVWYNSAGDCFFIKASAEGNTIASHVLAGDTFSNEDDTGITGTMPNNGAVTNTIASAGGTYTIPLGFHNGGGVITAPSLANVTSAGTITSGAQILSGYKAISNGTLYTGTIASKTATTYSPSTSAQTIASGQYLSGAQTIAATTGTANTGQVLSGYTFNSANGIGLTGTIANKGATTYTPSTSNQTISAGQYLSGAQTILGDADLIASNIISSANIFGVQGSATIASLGGYKRAKGSITWASYPTASFTFTRSVCDGGLYSNTLIAFTITGLDFTPQFVYISYPPAWTTIYRTNSVFGSTSWSSEILIHTFNTGGADFYKVTNTSPVSVTYGSFTLPVPGNNTNVPIEWVAYGI